MKRFALKLALFLLLGAIINVAVAWGCAYQQRWTIDRFNFRGITEMEGPGEFLRAYGILSMPSSDRRALSAAGWKANSSRGYLKAMNLNSFGLRIRSIVEVESTGCFAYEWRCSDQVLAGWPLVSMHGQRLNRAVEGDAYFIAQVKPEWHAVGAVAIPNSDPLSSSWCDVKLVPLKPIAKTFALNTIFYAAILWLLFAFPFTLRRRRRIKRGLCAKCGYDLRGGQSEVCPECGASASNPS